MTAAATSGHDAPGPVRVPSVRRHGVRPRHPEAALRVARGAGLAGVLLGAPQLLAPRRAGRLLGVGDDRAARATVGAVGVRELAVAAALLGDRRPARWLGVRLAGDVADVALGTALVVSGRAADRRRLAVAACGAAALALVDGAAAAWVARNQPETSETPDRGREVVASVTIDRPLDEVSAAWRELDWLPTFMHHLASVERHGSGRSRWRVRSPLGGTVRWDAQVVTDTPELLAWESVGGGLVRTYGSVRFVPGPGGRGTEVHAVVRYDLPGAALALPLSRLLGESPRRQVHDELRRFKAVMETGEVPVSEGTPEGVHARRLALQRPARPVDLTEHEEPAPSPSPR